MPVVNTVYFDPAVGGTGLTVSDDGHPTTGLDNNGHRVRFVPALQNLVYIGSFVKTKALAMDAQVAEVMSKVTQAKSIADSMVNNIGLSRVDGGDSFTSIWSSSIDGGSSGTVATVNINCGNAI